MQSHSLYSKLLFAAIGLLFANPIFGQDSLTIRGADCETLKRLEKYNIYSTGKIMNGYYIQCDKNGLVKSADKYVNGIKYEIPSMKEVDSLLNKDFRETQRKKEIIDIDGQYKNARFNGKKYIYDKNGLLLKIEIYKEGKYAGDAQID